MSLYNFILIDDSEFDLFIYEKLLIKSGVASSVTTFSSARAALHFLLTNPFPVSIMLLDLQMPDMNGFEFVEAFKDSPIHIQEKIRIFMLSSTIDQRDIENVKKNSVIIDLISKPLDINILKKTIEN